MRIRSRSGRGVAVTLVAAFGAYAAFLVGRPFIEKSVKARITREAAKLGLVAHVGDARLRPWLSLEVRNLVLENVPRLRIVVDETVVRPRLSLRGIVGRAARVKLSRASANLPGDVRLEFQPSTWMVDSVRRELRLERLSAGEDFGLALWRDAGGRPGLRAHATNARLSHFFRVLRHECVIADFGSIDGEGRLEKNADGAYLAFLRARTRGLALASLAGNNGSDCDVASLGAATDAEVEAATLIRSATGSFRANRLRLLTDGAEATGRLFIEGGMQDPQIDLQFAVRRLDLARLLATTGVDLPADDLGSAAFSGRVSGRLLDPESMTVNQRLDFTPPSRPLPALERLKQPFVHRVAASDGKTYEIRVSPDAPDFIAIAEVPPLFVRTLLLGEDSGFFGHRGIDLSEWPSAMAVNFSRGGFVRGASTISQQVAKNLFLSREKTVSRKIKEAALALLLDSALGKQRVLEIYLNVIEWGPGLYGLKPAARHYFGREPAALTPKQMAFLVCLIPGPIKYQRSFATGSPSPFFEGLMASLLAKLQAVDALSEEELEEALAEPVALETTATAPDQQ